MLLRCYTQNIDGLESVAGINSEKIVEAHGGFSNSHCTSCNAAAANHEEVLEACSKGTPIKCSCGGWIKPDIVFFGEPLPERFFTLTTEDFEKCDLLIVIGSSLVVYPFAGLVHYVNQHTPRLLINREPVQTLFKFNDEGE